MTEVRRSGLIGIFTRHPVASNLLMLMMLLAGYWGLSKLNTQFFPSFDIDLATVEVVWRGASAEDVEKLITNSLEQELENLDHLKKITSTSAEGVSVVTLEFRENTDMGAATDQVKELVDQVTNLPVSAETPKVTRIINYEPVASLLLTGPQSMRELRRLAHRFKRELLERGIARVSIGGMPEEEIAIQVSSNVQRELNLSLEAIGQRVAAASRDLPVGVIGRDDSSRQLRFKDQRRDELAFENLPVIATDDGRLITVGNIADVQRRPRTQQTSISYQGQPAITLSLSRAENSDSLEAARIFDDWLTETRPQLSPNVELFVYDARWQLIQQRISLLLKNGGGGLILVVLILFWFLSARVAWWVSIGIPVSFAATLAILYLAGGSINMVSLFALIMTLGIIVDDAIVVGEDAMTHFQAGETPIAAAEGGARRMLTPVMSSSLTTIAAFTPLLLVGGIIGNIMSAIPLVVICVIIASLIESFLVLPGHLQHSFTKMGSYQPSGLRQRVDNGFVAFREKIFRPLITKAVSYRWTVVALALAALISTGGLVAGKHLSFTFFPNIDGRTLFANIDFVAGTPASTVKDHLREVEQALFETEVELGGGLIATTFTRQGFASTPGDRGGRRGDQYGSIIVELTEPDDREVRNSEFIKSWQEKLPDVAGLENFSILQARGGPPGRDIEIRVTGPNPDDIKNAANDLKLRLGAIPGVSGLEDDTPYGREQLILSLTPTGEALGLTVEQVGRQLRSAYDGFLVQSLTEGDDEIEVRVVLPDRERNRLGSLQQLDIVLPDGATVPMSNVVSTRSQRGFEALRHADGQLALTLLGDVDADLGNANEILDQLAAEVLPTLSVKHSVEFSYEGRKSDQTETLGDMRRGAVIAVIMIYLVLAWVFGSYGWPLVVMAIIPFGLVGAVWGHYLMGLELTVLSLFGFFGLAGIVVNDSIILVVFFKGLREKGMAVIDAVVEAACQRLRAVLLTSLTTIAGLTPLLFETSLQAQFLIPMATSIAFGLAFATLLVLILVPSLLVIYERFIGWFGHDVNSGLTFSSGRGLGGG